MDENKANLLFEKNEYIFKILYLIRKNLPNSEFLYLLMFLLKYIGLILFSISLNVYDTTSSNNSMTNQDPKPNDNGFSSFKPDENINFSSDIPMKDKNGDFSDINTSSNNSDNSNNNMIVTIFKKLLINGDNFKTLNDSYQLICLIGCLVFIIYILLWIFGGLYMKKKYYTKVSISITDKKIKQINQSTKLEKRFFRCMTYILFLIVFFHQYILEYYFFGFFGYIFDMIWGLDTSGEKNNDSYTSYISNHLSNLIIPQLLSILIHFICIANILVIFVCFMLINSAKTLFINNNYPIHSDTKNLIINMFILNLNPIFGIVNYFNDEVKQKIVIVFIVIIIILILIKIAFAYFYFSPLPYKLNCLCIFIEFFALFGCITNLITFLTKSEVNSIKFCIIKAAFELLNALLFSMILLKQKNKKSMKIFSDNLFCTNFKTLNPSGIYYYIANYLKYSKNRENNYMTIFEPIQNHVLNCTNKDCPGHILLPKSLSYSIFTDFTHYSNKDNIKENNNTPKETPNPDTNISIKEDKYEPKKENNDNSDFKNNSNTKRSILKSLKSKSNIKIKSIKTRNKELNEKEKNPIQNNNNINKKMLEDAEFKMIGEQEIINRISYLYRRKKYDYLEIYIFIHIQYIIKIKQNYRLALYYLGKYSQSEIKFGLLSKFSLYEIKKYICKSIFNKKNSNLIQDPYIKKYKEENIKLGQLIDYISLFNIVRKILKVSCESIIQFYSFRRELHNSLSLQKYKKTKIYPIFQSSERIQTAIFKLQFLLEKLNKEKKHSLESVELSYLICNFFELINGRIPQEILSNVKPILYFKDSLYEKLINEFHLFMMNNPLIISLTQKDTFNIAYFTNIFLKKLGFSFSDLKNKDFHEKLFPGSQDLIKEHSLILKQFLFFYSNTYSKFNTFVKSKEGYLVSVNINCKVFPSFMDDFLIIANVIFNNDMDMDKNTNNKDKNINNIYNKIINSYSFMLNNDYEIFSLTKNFYIEYNLNQSMFRELRINFCQFFCVDENKLSKQIINQRKKILKENPSLNNLISLKESNKAYTIFQNISMKNLFKIREEKILATYNYPEMFIYEKIEKKKLIKKIPEIINIIDEIGLDYDWYIRLQNYKDRLTCYNDESSLTFNTLNSEDFFEAIFSIKKMGSIYYFVVNLNEIFNKDIENRDNSNKLTNKKSIINNNNKTFKKQVTKTSRFSYDVRNRKSIGTNSFLSNNLLKKMSENTNLDHKEKSKNFSGTMIKNKYNNVKFDEKLEKEKEKDKEKTNLRESLQSKKTKNSLYDNSEYLKSLKNKRKQFTEDEENTPLITRGKFNETLAKKEKKNKIFIFILYSIIITALCLIIGKTIQSLTAINENIRVLEMTINFEVLKVDIYIESILHMHYCIEEKKNNPMSHVTPFIQKEKLNILLEDLKNVQEHVSTILNNKHSFGIFKIIEERFVIDTLDSDWGISNRTVDILEETRRLSYIIGGAVNDINASCDIDVFYDVLVNNSGVNVKNYKNPNNKQKLFYYFNANILKNYKMTFEKLSEEFALSLEKMWKEYQYIHLILIFIVVAILFVFSIIYCIKYCLDNSLYQLLFLYYYKIENYQKIFETKIYYLYKTVLEFNYDNIKYFEFIKTNDDSSDLHTISNKFTNLLNNSNDNSNNKLNNKNKINSNKEKEEQNPNPDQNSMNGSLLNASMNGSSIQFLNKSNKLNLNNNNRIQNNNTPYGSKIEENEENKVSQEETIDSLMKFIINILPNSHRFSLIIILFSTIIYFVICLIDIYEIYNQLSKYDFSINLAMNILERVPRIMELVLYSSISTILNKTDLILPTNHQSPYLEYFKIDALYYSEEMLQTFFQQNLYGQILKDNLKLKYNLENYLYENKYSLFQNVQYWETMLNKIGDFCVNLVLGQVLSSTSNISSYFSDLYGLMETINNLSLAFKTQSPGIKDSGIKIEFNYILQEITTKYIEFIMLNKTIDKNLDEARDKFMDDERYQKVITDLEMYFGFYFDTISYAIRQDFEKQNSSTTNTQIIYSILFFIVNIEMIIALMVIFTKEEKYKRLFSYFSQIPKEEDMNI